jgi:iron complex outermembrane receptor protein
MKQHRRLLLSILTACWSIFASAQSPDSETADDETETVLEEVIVTGSRIPRRGFESLQPAAVLDRVDFEMRANLNVVDTLNEQPGFALGESPVGGQGAQIGQNTVNFLGLGAQRTLTLVNGQRFPASGQNGLQVDFNAIPSALVERVETISIGGAPIYGADAIAGTVNVILREDFEGLEILGSYGQSPEYSDAGESRASIAWGTSFADGRGNLTLAAEYNQVDGLRGTDRPLTSTSMDFEIPGDPDYTYDLQFFEDLTITADNAQALPLFFGNQFFFNVFGNGIPLDILDPASPLSAFDEHGNLVPFVPGSGTGSAIFQNGGDGLKLADYQQIYTDLERTHVSLFLNYDLNDSMRFNAEAWFANTDATELVSQPYFNSNAFGGLPTTGYGNVDEGPIPVLIDNPFLTESARETITTALNIVHDFNGDGVADPTIDTDGDGIPDAIGFWRTGALSAVSGDRSYGSNQDTWRFLVGMDGDVEIVGKPFIWDAFYTYGRVTSDDSFLALLQPNFEQAVQVIADANGNPACADPSGGCVPLDVMGTPSAEAIDYVTATGVSQLRIEQNVFSANLAGDLFGLPAGPVAAAGGIAYRKEESAFRPDELMTNGMNRYQTVPVSGSFDSKELYVEAVVPLLGGDLDTPGVHTLEFEGAIRWVDNSVNGADTTWTAGLRYRPVESLELRGNVTQSIRAPSITELFTPERDSGQQARDPCDARYIDAGNFPERRAANCAAEGITQPFQSFVVNATARGTLSGNENLDNEVADSYTYGLVYSPHFLESLVFSVDYIDIEVNDAISSLGLDSLMNACYDSANFANEPLCDLFTRDANFQVIDFSATWVNIDSIVTSGIQATGSYLLDLERHGNLRFDLKYYYLNEYTTTRGAENPTDIAGQIGANQHVLTASGIWNTGDWSFYTQVRWISSAVFNTTDDEFSRDIRGVDDWYVFNSSAAWRFTDTMSLQLNVDNLFDKEAPWPALASGQGLSMYYSGVVGRMARLTFQASFQ